MNSDKDIEIKIKMDNIPKISKNGIQNIVSKKDYDEILNKIHSNIQNLKKDQSNIIISIYFLDWEILDDPKNKYYNSVIELTFGKDIEKNIKICLENNLYYKLINLEIDKSIDFLKDKIYNRLQGHEFNDRSMSVGDIMIIEKKVYFVNKIGFLEIKDLDLILKFKNIKRYSKDILERKNQIEINIQNLIDIINSIKVKIKSLQNHPLLLKEQENKLSSFKKRLNIEKEELSNIDNYTININFKSERDLTKFDINLSQFTFDIDKKIMDKEGYSSDDLRKIHYKIILFMAKKGGEIHAMDVDDIIQRGRLIKTSSEHINIWATLKRKEIVEIVRDAPKSSQLPFLMKTRSGSYISKAGAGMELSESAIKIYRLTEKGWQKANEIVNFFLENK